MDKEVDLDFSSITGRKSKQVSPKPKDITTGKTDTLSGLSMTIPTSEPGKYIIKDLTECTGEEFVAWSSGVHLPAPMPAPEKLQEPRARYHIFKQILYFHVNYLFPRHKDDSKEELPN